MPTTVSNITANLTWQISFDGGQTFQTLPSTKQSIFVTAGAPLGFAGVTVNNIVFEAAPIITAARLNKVTTDFTGLISGPNVARTAAANALDQFGFSSNNLVALNLMNPWVVFDNSNIYNDFGFDCISLNEIAIVEILQIGVNSGLWFAYATTNGDASVPKTGLIQGQNVTLEFIPLNQPSNLFEAFIALNTAGVPTEAWMVIPVKGPLDVATDLVANDPIETGLSNEQRLAFSVIYNEEKADQSQQWWLNSSTKAIVQGPIPFPIPLNRY